MSSLWTPEGEHRVPKDDAHAGASDNAPAQNAPPDRSRGDDDEAIPSPEELAALESELLSAPVEAIIANHCYGFFQLAALHMSQRPPQLEEARLAIDTLAALVEAVGDRLGAATETLRDALAQIRLAYVQIAATESGGNGAGPSGTVGDGA